MYYIIQFVTSLTICGALFQLAAVPTKPYVYMRDKKK